MDTPTKICTKCGKELPITDFYWRDKAKNLRRSECKYCHNSYVKQNYQQRKQEIQDLKSECKCQKCGESRGYLLDFHHIDPDTKETTISRLTANNRKMELIEEEMAKCIVLCANCHREFHYLQNRDNTLTIERYIAS